MTSDANARRPRPDRSGSGSPDGQSRTALEQELEALYEQHAPLLLRYGFVLCGDLDRARDALQETFLRFHQARARRNAIREPRPWLFETLERVLREESAQARAGLALAGAAGAAAPERFWSTAALPQAARGALSPRELQCIEYRQEGYTQQETAAALHISPGTVATLMARAMRKLRRLLQAEL